MKPQPTDIGRRITPADLGVSARQLRQDLEAWEAWGFIKSPSWADYFISRGIDATAARLICWRALAKRSARVYKSVTLRRSDRGASTKE